MTAQDAILTLLAERAGDATICPSEAARLLAGPQGDWRSHMDTVHAATDALAQAGHIALSWKGGAHAKAARTLSDRAPLIRGKSPGAASAPDGVT